MSGHQNAQYFVFFSTKTKFIKNDVANFGTRATRHKIARFKIDKKFSANNASIKKNLKMFHFIDVIVSIGTEIRIKGN